MTTQNFNNTNGLYSSVSLVKPKTVTIDARYKEIYYQTQEPALKETQQDIQSRHVFWNYMMNVSMQNTIVQMAKIA